MKVLAKNGPAYLALGAQYLAKGEGEKNLLKIIKYLRTFRVKDAADALSEREGEDLRRSIFIDFPVMSKL